MNYAWILAIFLIVPATSSAMSPDSYRDLKNQASSADETTRTIITSSITGYFSGVADAYGVLQFGQREWRPIPSSQFAICIPDSVKISAELLRLATDSELELQETASSTTLTAYTLRGLQRMFPCGS